MSVTQRNNERPAQDPGHSDASGGAVPGVSRTAQALIWFATATLVVVSPLHLAGVIGNGPRVNPSDAGIAEAVIAVVLAAAAIVARRRPAQARTATVSAVSFAILGFGVGLSITARGGDAFDVAYHLIVLPILIVTLILLIRQRSTAGE